MGTTKTEVFTAADNRLADLARALGHPARVAILRLLAKRQACICGDIVDEIPLSQATVSQHLRELKSVGLIKGEVDGVRVCYCIDEKAWAKAQMLLGEFFDSGTVREKKCC